MGDIARAYDNAAGFRKHWGAYLVECGMPLVEGLPRDAERILDLGAGTGGNVPAIAARAPQARIAAADFVEKMIRLAPSRAARFVMDAQHVAFADETFDAAVMAFMLFHVPDTAAGLREVRRVLKPGGTLAVATWATEPHPDPAQHIWVEELDRAGAVALDPTVMRHETMDTTEKLATLIRDADFSDIQTATRDFSDPMDEEEFIRRRTTLGSSLVRFGSLDTEAQQRTLERARKRFSSLALGDFDSRERAVYAWAR